MNKMSPSEAKQIYLAIKLHFTSDSYDAIKYNFRVRSTTKVSSKDSFYFERLAKKYGSNRQNYIDFLVANFIKPTPPGWVSELVSSDADSIYKSWLKQRDSFTYRFTEDMDFLSEKCPSFNDLFHARKDNYPLIIEYYLQESVSLETVAVLESILNFMKNARVTETIVWPTIFRMIHKYVTFLSWVNRKKVSEIILSRFTSE